MSLPAFIAQLQRSNLVTGAPVVAGNRISIAFSEEPPTKPGVYVVYQRDPEKPFYVGEAGNLSQRLKFLFRCHRNENPHPCHKRHEQVHEVLPDVDDFCARYGVHWLLTSQLIGRLEIESAVQQALGTNRSRYYEDYDPKVP